MSKKTKGSQLVVPSSGSLWYGNQDSLDQFMATTVHLQGVSMMEMAEMRMKGVEMLSSMGSSKNRFENHYMVDTYADGKIAVISVSGVLLHHPLPLRAFGLNATTYGEIQTAVEQALQDERVEKIVMAYASGGGSGGGLFRTSNFLEKAAQMKEFTTFTDTNMGSAAYWLGVNSPKIITEPLAELGSIGVYITLESRAKMNEERGIDVKVVRAGEFKAMGHPDEPHSDKSLAEVQRVVDQSYNAFLDHASSKRGQNKETFRVQAAEGRMFFGPEAVKVNLADEVMVFDELIEAMMSTKSKTVPGSGAGRSKQMNEGTMNKKMLKLLQDAGVELTAEQQSQLASGASFVDIGLSADLAAKLDAAAADGDDDEGNDADKDKNLDAGDKDKNLDANKDEGDKDKNLNVTGDKSLTEMMSKMLEMQSQLTKLQGEATAHAAELTKLQADVTDRDNQLSLLKPLVAKATNRLNVALRKGEQEGLENLPTADLVKAYDGLMTKFETTFPVGRQSKVPTTTNMGGESRPLPDSISAAAKDATSI